MYDVSWLGLRITSCVLFLTQIDDNIRDTLFNSAAVCLYEMRVSVDFLAARGGIILSLFQDTLHAFRALPPGSMYDTTQISQTWLSVMAKSKEFLKTVALG